MKKLTVLFMFVFVLPMYPQDFLSSPYWYNIDTSKDTIEVDGKVYIHTPQYDTLVVDNWHTGTKWDTTTAFGDTMVIGSIGYYNYPKKYLILEDIKNPCPACDNTVFEKNTDIIFWSTYDYSYKYGDSAIGLESTKFTNRICKSCGNIYVARKQILKRIE